MAIYNLGSINIDYVYSLDAFPKPGETIFSSKLEKGLGGKGANQTIAAARAGGTVHHIGAIGAGDDWAVEILRENGAECTHVQTAITPSGHAVIYVDGEGENQIVLFAGSNAKITEQHVTDALAGAGEGDWLILQNETAATLFAARHANEKGMKVVYSAAPFDAQAVDEILPHIALLAVNEGEHAALLEHIENAEERLAEITLCLTKGSQGAHYCENGATVSVNAHKVDVVDTTGAGDTFIGYLVAGLDAHLSPQEAMNRAAAASAIAVTKPGAAQAIPTAQEVDAFLESRK